MAFYLSSKTNLKSWKGLIGGVVAAIIIYGDPVSDTECGTGYVNVENVCVETCALNPCEELIQIRPK